MAEILQQFSNLELSKFEIVLQAQTGAILPALIGSTLRGAFGHALKAISCSVQHQDCDKCFLSEVCLYPAIFEPTSNSKSKDIPRPFVFEPPIPPFSREISRDRKLEIYVAENGKISFGLTLVGEAAEKIPYFIYAFELMANHGLGASRQPFRVSEVFQIDELEQKNLIYEPTMTKIQSIQINTLRDFVGVRLRQVKPNNRLSINLLTPLRFRHKSKLIKNITFDEFLKRCSLRLKLLSDNYGIPFKYDYLTLIEKAKSAKKISDDLWNHNLVRCSTRQKKNLPLDGMLGKIEYAVENTELFLPYLLAGECLNVGSACGLGLGKFKVKN